MAKLGLFLSPRLWDSPAGALQHGGKAQTSLPSAFGTNNVGNGKQLWRSLSGLFNTNLGTERSSWVLVLSRLREEVIFRIYLILNYKGIPLLPQRV